MLLTQPDSRTAQLSSQPVAQRSAQPLSEVADPLAMPSSCCAYTNTEFHSLASLRDERQRQRGEQRPLQLLLRLMSAVGRLGGLVALQLRQVEVGTRAASNELQSEACGGSRRRSRGHRRPSAPQSGRRAGRRQSVRVPGCSDLSGVVEEEEAEVHEGSGHRCAEDRGRRGEEGRGRRRRAEAVRGCRCDSPCLRVRGVCWRVTRPR